MIDDEIEIINSPELDQMGGSAKFEDKQNYMDLLKLYQEQKREAGYTLSKAHNTQSRTTTDLIQEVEYEKDIKNTVITEAPFLAFIESRGRVQSNDNILWGWRVKTPLNKARFIDELENIPDYMGKNWNREWREMTTITYPMSVSYMAQMGTSTVNLQQDELMDGYADIARLKEETMLKGPSNMAGKTWDNLKTGTGNSFDKGGTGANILDIVLACDAINKSKGTIHCIVTSTEMIRNIEQQMHGSHMIVNKQLFVPGQWVTGFFTQNGYVPLIGSRNAQINANTSDLYITDLNAILMKELLGVSEFNLPAFNLASNTTLATFVSFGIMEKNKTAVIRNIDHRVPVKANYEEDASVVKETLENTKNSKK